MKTLYLDCAMGAAGDMLTAALLELLDDQEDFLKELNSAGIPHALIEKETAKKCGITGTHISVKIHGEEEGEHDHHHHHHHHSGMHDIAHIIGHLNIKEKIKKDILAVYDCIAQAESTVHGVPVTEVHFHEVGAMDAVADITAVCMLMDRIGADEVVASPVCVGSGYVKCAHGLLPVPAPATALILKDIPIYSGEIKTELCTPTGAALLKHFADRFAEMPPMTMQKIGYGMGKKEFDRPNCVRAILGESSDKKEDVAELSCNIDDMTAEAIGYALEMLMEEGALDAYTMPIGMKKCRPAVKLSVLTTEQHKENMVRAMFRYTTTLGIRETKMQRYTLERRITEQQTACGTIRRKDAFGYGVKRSKYEYEDIACIARERGISIDEVKELL